MAAFVFAPPLEARFSPPEFQFMIMNITKPANVGNMIRSAIAMGCTTCVVVGKNKINGFGSLGTDKYCVLNHFTTADEARSSLIERGFEIVGIEIGTDAVSVLKTSPYRNPSTEPATTVEPAPFFEPTAFKGPTCFVFGEEGHGMTEKVKQLCQRLVYIPQFGHGTASLNVSNAAAIIFFQFANWAQYKEREIVGEKFLVDKTLSNTYVSKDESGDIVLNDVQLRIREARAVKRQKKEETDLLKDGNEEVCLTRDNIAPTATNNAEVQ